MESSITAQPKKIKGFVKSSTLLLLAIASGLFPRLLTTLKIPSLVNFLHFALVPFAFGSVLLKSRTKDITQRAITQEMVFALWLFLTIEVASALLNDAGIVNVILSYLLWVEPFILLATIIYLPMTIERFEWFKSWMNRFIFFHFFLIYVQKFVLRLERLEGQNDNMQGIFYRSGSGHVVGASVSCSFAIYYFLCAKDQPLWKRTLVAVLGFGNVIVSDAKQVVITLVLGFLILSLTKVQNVGKFLSYVIGIATFCIAFTWAIYNVEALSAFTGWIRPEMYGSDGPVAELKFSGIQLTIEQFHSPLNWWLGLGPGHTVDRLGGWMLKDYSSLLSPLGATRTTIGEQTRFLMESSWLMSSFFAPFWGWAAIWCDLGTLGLASYLYLCSIVWRRICVGDLPKFLMLTVMVHGFIFTQMQEPGYVLYVASLIGLYWHQKRFNI
ncbi:MAG: hypothetical protein NW224_06510 [Leptolyngbyaceae cyanobacterium bins.302]|nr:hypothetical protein [Leptolyngbyaceae cyanobacterium bins.302]